MKKEYASEGHDLTNPAPFKNLHIPLPEKLETDADFTQLFHWMISDFHLAINAYKKRFGYGDRQRLLVYILNALKVLMPKEFPEYITNYPKSLDDIKGLVGQIILMSMDYTGMHPEEDGAEELYKKDSSDNE